MLSPLYLMEITFFYLFVSTFIVASDLSFEFDQLHIKPIDANHGVFLHSFASHFHSFYELHYIVKGRGKLILESTTYDLYEGLIFLIPSGISHAQLTDENDPMEEYHFSFEIKNIPNTSDNKIHNIFIGKELLIAKDKYDILKLFTDLEIELNQQILGYEIAVKSILSRILISTIRDFSFKYQKLHAVKTPPDSRRYLILDEAFLYSYKDLTLDILANQLNLSPRHTQRLINEKYGTTFAKLRLQSRLNAAANMITSTSLSLSDIAEKCGFCNYLYFSKSFKNTFGIPPSEYKLRNKQ